MGDQEKSQPEVIIKGVEVQGDVINQKAEYFGVGVDKRTINQNSRFYENSTVYENENSLEQTIYEICNRLNQQYPNASESEKQTVLKLEINHTIEKTPKIKERFLNSLKTGGYEITKVLSNNPFISVPLEMVRGWFEV